MNTDFSSAVKKICLEEGFFKTGFSKIDLMKEESAYLAGWISEGRNADMHWISKSFDKRENPQLIMPEAVSMISLAFLYDTPFNHDESKPKIS